MLQDWRLPLRFEVTEEYLVARVADGTNDGPVVMVMLIDEHRRGPCEGSYVASSGPEELSPQGQSAVEENVIGGDPPWYTLPWMVPDFSQQLQTDDLAFDAATAAGYPDAVVLESLGGEPRVVALEQGYLELTFDATVRFVDAEDGTPGCAFDVPDFDPALACPDGEITVRYELRRR